MADLEGNVAAKDYGLDRPQVVEGTNVKGAGQLDFGMRHRLGRIFRSDGRTVMLAFDHGYFQGPTSGLERVDLNIVPLAPYADALMATRGIMRTVIPAGCDNALVLRASGGPSILKDLSDERIAMDIVDAVRIDAAAVAVQVFIGGEHETQSVANRTQLLDAGSRSWPLADLIRTLVEAHGDGATRLRYAGDAEAMVDGHAAMVIALVIGELTNNSIKYGALREGRGVSLTASMDASTITIRWVEQTNVAGIADLAPRDAGSGYAMMERMARAQRATFEHELKDGQLRVTLRVRKADQ